MTYISGKQTWRAPADGGSYLCIGLFVSRMRFPVRMIVSRSLHGELSLAAPCLYSMHCYMNCPTEERNALQELSQILHCGVMAI